MAVVVSCLAADPSELARLAQASARDADWIELRLDRLATFDETALAALIASLGKPVIAACNGPESYGHFRGSREELFARLRGAARAGASFVDVDWRLAHALGALEAPTRRIVSRHEPATRALDASAWLGELAAVAAPGDVKKLVHEATSAEEALELLALLPGAGGELVAFSSGVIGRFSRLLAPLLGSPWTYAAPSRGLDAADRATAPGQWPADELARELARLGPGPVELFGVVGAPIAHSLSPAVHGELFRAAGRRAVYAAFEARDFARLERAARALGVRGLSITAPFKADALRLAAEADASASTLGAANTLAATAHGWRASNTDLAGVRALFDRAEGLLGRPLDGLELCILGAGGAARALVAVAREREMRIALAVRDPARAEAFAESAGARVLAWDELATRSTDVLVNATPVGLRRGEIPLPAAWVRARLVIDALYRPAESELLRTARERGVLTLNGETWFLAQAAEQARTFSGSEPDRLALLRSFRAAVQSTPPLA